MGSYEFDNYYQIYFDVTNISHVFTRIKNVTNISHINKTYNKIHNYKYSLYS